MIEIRKPGKYYVNGVKQNMVEMNKLMQESPDAYAYWEKSKAPRTLSGLFGFVGGFGFGWTIGSILRGDDADQKTQEQKKFDTSMAIAGISGLTLGIALGITANNYGEKAVSTYNYEMGEKRSSSTGSYWRLETKGAGLALVHRF